MSETTPEAPEQPAAEDAPKRRGRKPAAEEAAPAVPAHLADFAAPAQYDVEDPLGDLPAQSR